MFQRTINTGCKQRGEFGEVKASVLKCPMTSSVLGQKFEIVTRPLLRHRQLAGGLKAQSHFRHRRISLRLSLSLGGLTPKLSSEYD